MRPGVLIKRTHRVSIYTPQDDGAAEDEYGYPIGGSFVAAPVATDVECNLQPLSGDVTQTAAGREVDADWQAGFPEATPLVEDQGVVVTAVLDATDAWVAPPVSHPTRFRVRSTGWQGLGWDTWAMLRSTPEAIP